MKNPKEKGNNFERKVAGLLTKWSGVKFLRTPSSGAIHNFKDRRVVSDIVPPLSFGEFPFSIECKNVNCSWEFSALLEGTSETLKKHWKQCCEDAQREGLRPLLVFTKNFRNIYCVLTEEDYAVLNVEIIPNLTVGCLDSRLVILNFENFLQEITPEKLKNFQSFPST